MSATFLAPPAEMIHLSGISWQTYETLLEELSDRCLRLTYNRGTLEITAPSPEHDSTGVTLALARVTFQIRYGSR